MMIDTTLEEQYDYTLDLVFGAKRDDPRHTHAWIRVGSINEAFDRTNNPYYFLKKIGAQYKAKAYELIATDGTPMTDHLPDCMRARTLFIRADKSNAVVRGAERTTERQRAPRNPRAE